VDSVIERFSEGASEGGPEEREVEKDEVPVDLERLCIWTNCDDE